jgi:transcriptional regulator with XRE-family HTH domain
MAHRGSTDARHHPGAARLSLGRPQSFISKYEHGERRLDFVEVLEIAQALGVDPGELIGELQRH